MRTLMLAAILLSSVLWSSPAAIANDTEFRKMAGGLTAYLGVLPAALIRGHAEDDPESLMHGGVASRPHDFHVMVALFDAESGERVEDAVVEARVTPLGLAPVTRRLEPMAIAGAVTYGNYFTMRGDGWYRIDFIVTLPGIVAPVVLEFRYPHASP